VSLSYYSKINN